ncbi:hypothetical protein GDO81_019090 [Engystomops pustulosus]|uniref:Uncharacterized protein n=1 Tax=Engystomops pustulosus TaxID=76066 RepID=A0AAV6YL61_ENGPU|nr:hypothetical protein GDO81_019090 [Engystomops pustulosus]
MEKFDLCCIYGLKVEFYPTSDFLPFRIQHWGNFSPFIMQICSDDLSPHFVLVFFVLLLEPYFINKPDNIVINGSRSLCYANLHPFSMILHECSKCIENYYFPNCNFFLFKFFFFPGSVF